MIKELVDEPEEPKTVRKAPEDAKPVALPHPDNVAKAIIDLAVSQGFGIDVDGFTLTRNIGGGMIARHSYKGT